MFWRILKIVFLIILFLLLVFISYFFIGFPKPTEKITWGVNFSQKHAQNLGLDSKETYLALLDDLKVKNLKIATHWDLIEPREGDYNFEDLDWQISQAEKRETKILLVVGMKTGRWPECHLPQWAKNLSKEKQQEKILNLIENTVLRYRGRTSVEFWQVENEPFFRFGECPEPDKELLKKEIALLKSLDQERPIIISESGEFPFWFRAALYGDIVGITIYRKVWFSPGFYFSYPFPPIFYQRKALLIKKIFAKKVISIELQAEPWGPKLLYDISLAEQEKTMNLKRFKENIEFAKKTGLDTFYLWGGEWWFWLKEKQNKPEIWQEAKKLF